MIPKIFNIQRLLLSGVYTNNLTTKKKTRTFQFVCGVSIFILQITTLITGDTITINAAMYPCIMLLVLFENSKDSLVTVPIRKKDIINNIALAYPVFYLFILVLFYTLLPLLSFIIYIVLTIKGSSNAIIEIEKISGLFNTLNITFLSFLYFYCIYMVYVVFSYSKKYIIKIASPIIFTMLLLFLNSYLQKIIPFIPKYQDETPCIFERLLRLYNNETVLLIALLFTIIIVSACSLILIKKRNLFL